METRPRTRKRLSERIPEPLSDFALLIAGDTPSWQHAFLAYGEEFPERKNKSSQNPLCGAPPNKSSFFVNNSATLSGDSHTSVPCGTENFSKFEEIKLVFSTETMGAVRIRHSIREIATQPVILWTLLGGKPKWLPLNFGFNDVMRTAPIDS